MINDYKITVFGAIPKHWQIVEVNDITKEHKQGYYTKDDYVENGIRLARITDLNNPIVDYSDMPKLKISDSDFQSYKIEKNDFLFARSGAIGRYGIVEKNEFPAIFASYLIRFRFNSDIVNRFFGYFFESNLCSKQLKGISQGNANININAENIKSLKFPRPPLSEQQKIAEILSTVDAKIEIIDQQISETQELKKGLMQQLLTKGIGHAEFKDSALGKIPKSWEVVKLGDLFKLSSGSGLSKAIAVEGEFQVYGGNGFAYYHNEFTHENSELIIGRVGAKCGCIHRTTEKSWITDNALIIHTRLKDFDDLYLEYVLRKLDLNQFANKNAQPVISGGKIYSIRISLPSLLEQNEISSILSSVDDKLEVLSEKKITYQELKQGLMQQLLTGKVRV
jgi:type I restriction enzyme S subunit